MTDFYFQNDGLCRLEFLNFDFFLAHVVQKAKMHQHSKFRRNQSNGF